MQKKRTKEQLEYCRKAIVVLNTDIDTLADQVRQMRSALDFLNGKMADLLVCHVSEVDSQFAEYIGKQLNGWLHITFVNSSLPITEHERRATLASALRRNKV